MAKAQIKPYSHASRSQIVQMIAAVGHYLTFVIQGETGIGKSALLTDLKALPQFDKHRLLYLDCTTKEAGDLAMPKIRPYEGKDVLTSVPHEELGMQSDVPAIILVDEVGKATKAVQNVLCRYMYERKIGDWTLPEGSVIIAATNLADEGFGDNAPAYMRNRVCFVTMRKPNAEEWVEWALENSVHPSVLQAVNEFTGMLASYTDYSTAGDNKYIFDPRQPRQTFVTPRSLVAASTFLKHIEGKGIDSGASTHALIGLIGEQGAMDMMSVHQLFGELPKYDEVIKNPEKAIVPKQAGATCLFVYTAIQNVEDKHVSALMTYLQRLPKEAQALFCSSITRTSKAPVVTSNRAFINWAKANTYLFREN